MKPPPFAVHRLEPLALRQPFFHYQALFAGQPYSFLLDSAADAGALGRYSMLGGEPFLVYRAVRVLRAGRPHAASVELLDGEGRVLRRYVTGDPFADLRALLTARHFEAEPSRFPLLAGAVGFFSYEAGRFVEQLPERPVLPGSPPDVHLALHDCLLLHCHRSGESALSIVGRGASEEQARASAAAQRERMLRRVDAFERQPPSTLATARSPVPVHATCDETRYCQQVEQIQRHLAQGDAFEVCLTQRLRAATQADPWQLYRQLRALNPAPFAAFVRTPELAVISSSPERFLRLDAARIAESRPIKGTRARGADAEADQAARRALAGSMKDRAEHTMIVDLVRNDLGRVCRYGSVQVPELRAIEAYATVLQMVSTVRGELSPERDGMDLLRACFPGGSMTGAPKIEAMKIIDRLEADARGVYSGALGYFDFRGALDLSIVIRTLTVQDGVATFGVGGAIVTDSRGEDEYAEAMLKAKALIEALERGAGSP